MSDVPDATKWVDELRGYEEPPTDSQIIAGAIYDFAGFLTTRDKVIKVGASANAAPVADLVKEWAEMRGLSLKDAAVLWWQDVLEEPPNSTTDVVEPEEWDHPPMRDCDCPHCKEYWSDVYGVEPVAWIGHRKDGAVELTDTKPTDSVRREFNMRPLYAAPPKHDLLNQTCCECGKSGGYALYCGECWGKATKREWQGLTDGEDWHMRKHSREFITASLWAEDVLKSKNGF